MSAPPRYSAERPLPPYTFVPGQAPHPTRDPLGHSFGRADERALHVPAAAWRTNADYLFGVDLYNAGFFWEAHEAWEPGWKASQQAGDAAQQYHLQGLIQCAAACVKSLLLQERAVRMLAERGTELLDHVARTEGPTYLGIDDAAFAHTMRQFAATTPLDPAQRPLLWLIDAGAHTTPKR